MHSPSHPGCFYVQKVPAQCAIHSLRYFIRGPVSAARSEVRLLIFMRIALQFCSESHQDCGIIILLLRIQLSSLF